MIKKLTKEVVHHMLASIPPQATGRQLVSNHILVGYRQTQDGFRLTVQSSERGERSKEVEIANDPDLGGLVGLLNGNKAVAVRIA